jgi:hypothetical protein
LFARRSDAADMSLTGVISVSFVASAAQPETPDQGLVTSHAGSLEIVQQPAPLADHDKQATP